MSLTIVVLLVGSLGLVLGQSGVQEQCPDPQESAVRVTVRTVQNQTGLWDTQVVLNPRQADDNYVWVSNVDQNVIECGGEIAPIIETVLHIRAGPRNSSLVDSSPTWPPPSNTEAPGSNDVTAPPGRSIPYGYEYFPGVGYYKLHPQKVNWAVARRYCASEGGHLVIIKSERERQVVKQIIARQPGLSVWYHAGILEFGTHAEWFTLFGQPLGTTGFATIYPGEDNAPGVSDFGCLHHSVEGYGDAPISVQFPFVCELNLCNRPNCECQ